VRELAGSVVLGGGDAAGRPAEAGVDAGSFGQRCAAVVAGAGYASNDQNLWMALGPVT